MLQLEEMEKLFPFQNNEEVYLLIAFARKKYNELLDRTFVLNEIVESPDKWMYKIYKLTKLAESYPYNFTLHVTQNPRSIRKALLLFKNKLAKVEFEGIQHNWNVVKRLDKVWKSCLMSDFARARRQYFIIDVDVKQKEVLRKVLNILKEDMIEQLYVQETKSGYHILTKPFNMEIVGRKLKQAFPLDVEILKDANFFLMEI